MYNIYYSSKLPTKSDGIVQKCSTITYYVYLCVAGQIRPKAQCPRIPTRQYTPHLRQLKVNLVAGQLDQIFVRNSHILELFDFPVLDALQVSLLLGDLLPQLPALL